MQLQSSTGLSCVSPKAYLYQATVTRCDNSNEKTYIGLSENSFKTRYNGHKSTFKNSNQRFSTTLRTLKDSNVQHTKIMTKCKIYSSNKLSNLCLQEVFLIVCRPDLSSLDKRNEHISTCRHRKKLFASGVEFRSESESDSRRDSQKIHVARVHLDSRWKCCLHECLST